jgi:hypothetical protein
MAFVSLFTLFVAFRLFILVSGAPAPLPVPVPATTAAATSSSYWVANIARQGTVPFGTSGYQIFRNVLDFGATGNGVTDGMFKVPLWLTPL